MILFLTASLMVLFSAVVSKNSLMKNSVISKTLIFIFTLIIILFVPTFNIFFSDLARYVNQLELLSQLSIVQSFKIIEGEPLFFFMQLFISRFTADEITYVIITFLLYTSILVFALSRLFKWWQLIFIYYAYFTFPFFFSYIFNGARQGFAMMFMLMTIVFLLNNEKPIKYYLSTIAASLFHFSALPIGLLIIVVTKAKIKLKILIYCWVFFAFLFLFDLNEKILQFDMIQNIGYVESYTDPNIISHFGETNKISFLLFSAFFIVIALFLYRTIEKDEITQVRYLYLTKIYVALNSYFVLFGFIAYSNRLATYSWFLIPILILYPILHSKRAMPLNLFIVIFVFFIVGIFFSPFIVYS